MVNQEKNMKKIDGIDFQKVDLIKNSHKFRLFIINILIRRVYALSQLELEKFRCAF